jgi:protein transport protein SEC61 subunit gamma-like protein
MENAEEQQTQEHREQKEQKPTVLTKLKDFTKESIRVLKVTKKPTKDELKVIVKVSGLGIIAIGLIGFIITMIRQLLFK